MRIGGLSRLLQPGSSRGIASCKEPSRDGRAIGVGSLRRPDAQDLPEKAKENTGRAVIPVISSKNEFFGGPEIEQISQSGPDNPTR